MPPKSATSSKPAASSTPIAVPAPVILTAPIKAAAAPKTPRAPKAKTVPVVPTTTEAAPATDATPVVDAVPAEDDELTVLEEKVASAIAILRDVSARLKAHKKAYAKIKKQAAKADLKRSTARKSGLTKPIHISEELATFLGLPKDVEIARTDVTRKLSAYFKEHNLHNPENRRMLLPNAALAKLLNIDVNDKSVNLSFFNLQSFLKHHFVSKNNPVVSA